MESKYTVKSTIVSNPKQEVIRKNGFRNDVYIPNNKTPGSVTENGVNGQIIKAKATVPIGYVTRVEMETRLKAKRENNTTFNTNNNASENIPVELRLHQAVGPNIVSNPIPKVTRNNVIRNHLFNQDNKAPRSVTENDVSGNKVKMKMTAPIGCVSRADMETKLKARQEKLFEKKDKNLASFVNDNGQKNPSTSFTKTNKDNKSYQEKYETDVKPYKTSDQTKPANHPIQHNETIVSKTSLNSSKQSSQDISNQQKNNAHNNELKIETTRSENKEKNALKQNSMIVKQQIMPNKNNINDQANSVANVLSDVITASHTTLSTISQDSLSRSQKLNSNTSIRNEQGKQNTLKIMIMNANGNDDKLGSPTERRKNAIQNIVVKHLPDILLFQEFHWTGITGKTWSKYPFPSNYMCKGHGHASIMYNVDSLTIQDLPHNEIATTLSGLQSNSNNQLKVTFPLDFAPLSRMCITRVIAITQPAFQFICISWHGNSNENGGGKMKNLKKIEYFKYLIEFLRNIREKYKLPMMIGGDFNVDMYSIETSLHSSPFKLCTYDALKRRTVKGIIDYFIISEDLSLEDISSISLASDTTVFCPDGILDHDPVIGILKPVNDLNAKVGIKTIERSAI